MLTDTNATGHNDERRGRSERRGLMIYVHVPFCRSKCTFCDWVAPVPASQLFLRPEDSARQRYIDALCVEIAEQGPILASSHVPRVMYWGGGTASSLDDHEVRRIMAALDEAFDLTEIEEATMECSPDTTSAEALAAYRALGFNRISSGVQSFDDGRLKQLGRRHDGAQARAVVTAARDAGFDNVSIDLMCGLPGQPLRELYETVQVALSLPISHLSLYPFRPTPGTNLRHQLDKDRRHLGLAEQKAAFEQARSWLSEGGWVEYASGYFGRRSLFAELYFQLGADTVGLGSGATSMVNGEFRLHRNGDLEGYTRAPTTYDLTTLVTDERIVVSLLRAGLSHFEGIERRTWLAATGMELDDALALPRVAPLVGHLRSRGLIDDHRGIRMPSDEVGGLLIELSYQITQASAEGPIATHQGGVALIKREKAHAT